MIVNHADERHARSQKRINHREVRHFVDIDGIGPELAHRPRHSAGLRDGEAGGEGGAPSLFGLASGGAVKDADGVAATRQFRGGDVCIGLGSRKGSEAFVDV